MNLADAQEIIEKLYEEIEDKEHTLKVFIYGTKKIQSEARAQLYLNQMTKKVKEGYMRIDHATSTLLGEVEENHNEH